jgi:hypothetical protein
MARGLAAVLLVASTLLGCSTLGSSHQYESAEVAFTISKPRIDLENLRSAVVAQPSIRHVVGSGSTTVFPFPHTRAVVCENAALSNCQHTTILSRISVRMNPAKQRVEGVWQVTYGGDVTGEYGITGGSRTTIRHETGSAQPNRTREIPFSVDVGTSASIDGPFEMSLEFSVAK